MQGMWEGQIYEDTEQIYVWLLANGSLRFASMHWNSDKMDFDLRKGSVIVSTYEGIHYLNITFDESNNDQYLFFRVVHSPGDIITLFPPNYEEFKAAIKTRKLSGTMTNDNESRFRIKGDNIYLTDIDKLKKYIDPDKFNKQFRIESPFSFIRIDKYLGPYEGPTIEYLAKQNHTRCLPKDLIEYLTNAESAHITTRGIMQDIISGADPEEAMRKFAESSKQATVPTNRNISTSNGIVTRASFTHDEYKSYRSCMKKHGYALHSDKSKNIMYIVKDGLGIFEFEIKTTD
jgi:hypothetical protein